MKTEETIKENLAQLAEDLVTEVGAQPLIDDLNFLHGEFMRRKDYQNWKREFRESLWLNMELVKKILTRLELAQAQMRAASKTTDRPNLKNVAA